ncbi:MAG: SGNH/GDSL hydrolase family protein [Thermodesulfobacteriota bacterium]
MNRGVSLMGRGAIRWGVLLVVVLTMGACSSSDDPAEVADVSGAWEFFYTETAAGDDYGPIRMEIVQSGGTVDLTLFPPGEAPITGSGTTGGTEILMNIDALGDLTDVTLDGTVAVDEMFGSWTAAGGRTGSWEAFRAADGGAVVLINLGDSLTNGIQSYAVNEFTQSFGYTQVLAEQMAEAVPLFWNNPLLTRFETRIDPDLIPYNLGVDGATTQEVIVERTGSGNPLLDELLAPLPERAGRSLSQLEAAEYLADLYPNQTKVFTLWIGNNDVLGAVTRDFGSRLTEADILDYLSDTEAGHDLDAVEANLSEIVDRLAAFPDSHVFVANIPYVTQIGFLFNEADLERLAAFPQADVTSLAPGQSVGFGPVLNPDNPDQSIARGLGLDNFSLNGLIFGTVSASDGFSLTAEEAVLINNRVDAINDHIAFLARTHSNVTLVDTNALFQEVIDEEIVIAGDVLYKTLGGGVFSLDGVHPSDTGYALVANEFIRTINFSDLNLRIPEADVEAVWAADPYIDGDGDFYVDGPDPATISPLLVPLIDCDDTDPDVVAPYVSGTICF